MHVTLILVRQNYVHLPNLPNIPWLNIPTTIWYMWFNYAISINRFNCILMNIVNSILHMAILLLLVMYLFHIIHWSLYYSIMSVQINRPEPIMLFKLPIMLLSNAPKCSLLCPNYAPLWPIMLHKNLADWLFY